MNKSALLFAVLFAGSLSVKGQQGDPLSFYKRNAAIELTNSAILLIEERDFVNAFLKLKEAITTDSLYEKAYLHVYQLNTLIRTNAEESLEIFRKGKAIFKEHDEFFFYCGEIYRLNSKKDKAIYEYTKAIELAKNNGEEFYLVPFYYLNRGNLYLYSEKLEPAINDYTDLLRLNPVSTAGFTNRGIAYHMLGEQEKACRDWESAIALGFQQAYTYHKKNCRK